jgi:cyclophilin family peptidyl-prolyl cis-trans isomerase
MNFVNREMKVDQLVGYINSGKINLIPWFQRGTVWPLTLRKKLLENIVRGRPIPAIFLYKDDSAGSMFAYNILDGKQRLESIMLFVGNKRTDIKINALNDFFFDRKHRKIRNFKIELDGELIGFDRLDDFLVRNFLEYAIPTIEISLEDSSMGEIVELFVDINSYGVKVSRFDVVKAMVKDPFLGTVLDLVAVKQQRQRAIHYKAKSSPINRVMGRLSVVARLEPSNARVDRVWERLAEIALFARTGKHRRPVAILNAFIKGGDAAFSAITEAESKRIRNVFKFLDAAYTASPSLAKSRLATNEPQFYTMVTSLLSSDLLSKFAADELINKLTKFGQIVEGKMPAPDRLAGDVSEFLSLVAKATTDIGKRGTRQVKFLTIVNAM